MLQPRGSNTLYTFDFFVRAPRLSPTANTLYGVISMGEVAAIGAPFLTKFVLGVTGAQPGFEAVTVTPFVSRAYPTVGGSVPVRAGATVLVQIRDENATTVASATTTITADMRWRVSLPPQPASIAPMQLIASMVATNAVADPVLIRDVLFGDVYVCSGQSNMGK